MSTVNRIIKSHWYTKKYLLECEKKWICNGMGWKGGIQWTDKLRKLPYFKKGKEKQLLIDLDLISDIHDLYYLAWWWVMKFIKANYLFCIDLLQLLNWTLPMSRLILFIISFVWLNVFGRKYFNFK